MITMDNYEAMLLQYHEGMLNDRQRKEVEAFLRQHPDIEREYRLYYSSEPIVTPPETGYMYKKELKRQADHAPVWIRRAAAACAVAIATTTVWLWSTAQNGGDTGTTTTEIVASAKHSTNINTTADTETPLPPAIDNHAPAATVTQRNNASTAKTRCATGDPVNTLPTTMVTEEKTATHCEVLPPSQSLLSESDRLVIYGCPVETRNNLVASPDDNGACRNLACRLIATGQKMGML